MTSRTRRELMVAGGACVVLAWAGSTLADPTEEGGFPSEWMDALSWRSVGPANMGGRITDLAVYEADPCIWWAATASGGLIKTINNGVSFEHQFDGEATVSIGDVAVAQSDPSIVWVGTGESNPRNSVSWGNGVYKSTDGGKTWTHMGLEETFQIGAIVIHPKDPETVYVGALGRLWGPNEQRGLFKTTDGGATWEKILFVDDMSGVIDLHMHPADPDTLLVAMWERERDGFDTNDPAKKWGPGSGLYRTTDGGASFDRITEGLPGGELGRIGLDWYRADPNVVYAVVESDRIGKQPENAPYLGVSGEDADVGARLTDVVEDGPAAAAEIQKGDIVIRMGDQIVQSYQDLLRQMRQHVADETVEVEVSRERKSVVLEVTFTKRPNAEEDPEEEPRPRRRRSSSPFSSALGGQRENVHDQQGPEGYEFGGLYRSSDAGLTWERINSVNPRPMYFSEIRVDPSDNDHLFVLGISLYRSKDGGETFTRDGGRGVHPDHHAMWIDPNDGRHMILGNDGGLYVTHDRMDRWEHLNRVAIGQFYHVTVDPRPNYAIYGGLQDNGSWGGPGRARSGSGPINEDWFRVGGGDGFVCRVDREDPDQIYYESQNGGMGSTNLRTGDRGFVRPRPPRGTRYRFNWQTPFILSHHNSRIHYAAGNHVFRSLNRGQGHKQISPEITRTDKGSASALAESPLDSDVLYVGSDDGALWMTENGGQEWVDLFAVTAEAAAAASEAEATAEPEPRRRRGEGQGERRDEPRGEGRGGEGGPRGEGRGGGGRGGGGRMAAFLERADENGDGKIQRDEVPERMSRMFDRLDANDDGVIDKAEMASMRDRAGRGRGEGERRAPSDDDPEAAATPAADEPEAVAEPKPDEEAEAKPDAPAEVTEEPAGPSDTEATAADDPISGHWKAKRRGENVPPDRRSFVLDLRLNREGAVTGNLESEMNDGAIDAGTFDAETGRLAFEYAGERFTLSYDATVKGDRMTGTIALGDMWSVEFEAKRESSEVPAAIAEAPEDAGDGHDWKVIGELVPGPRWVSSLEPSRYEAGRVYVTFDGHRSNDDEPYLFVSENHGRTWRSIRANLPAAAGTVRALREDVTNPDILYLGCEFSAWVTIDRGASWSSLNTNLPTVAVHEIAQHPTCGDVIVATHGRSLWVLDATPLRRLAKLDRTAGVQLLEPNEVHYWRSLPSRGGAQPRFVGQNPPDAAEIYFCLDLGANEVTLRVTDQRGKTVRDLTAPTGAGMHRVQWDLRRERSTSGRPTNRRRRGGPRVAPGTYVVTLEVDGEVLTQPLRIHGDPEYRDAVLWGEAYDEMLEHMAETDGPADTRYR